MIQSEDCSSVSSAGGSSTSSSSAGSRQGTSAGAKLTISDPESLLEGRKGGAVLTATGGISGTFTLDTGDVEAGNLWRLVQRDANTLALSSARGTMVVFR